MEDQGLDLNQLLIELAISEPDPHQADVMAEIDLIISEKDDTIRRYREVVDRIIESHNLAREGTDTGSDFIDEVQDVLETIRAGELYPYTK